MKGILFIYLLTAAGAIGALMNPAFGLVIYAGYSLLRPDYLWGWAGNIKNVSFVIGVCMLVGWFFKGFGSWKVGPGRAIVGSLIGFLVWSALSSVQAINRGVANNAVLELSKIVLPFLVGITMLKSEKQAKALLWVMVIAQAYVCLQMNEAYFFDGYNRIQDQGFGGMDNNSMGISLVTLIGSGVALALMAKSKLAKGIALVSVLLILHTTLLTFSRGALVGLLVVAAVTIIVMPKRKLYLAMVLAVLLAGYRLTGKELTERFATTFATEDQRDLSAQSRLDQWSNCLEVAAEFPVFGVGPNNWPVIARQRGFWGGKEAHSVWMQTLAEVGIPGVAFLLAFYGLTIMQLLPIARDRSPEGHTDSLIATGVLSSIVGYVVSAQFVSLGGLEAPFYIAMSGAILLKTRELRLKGEPSPRPAVVVRPTPRRYSPVAAAARIGR